MSLFAPATWRLTWKKTALVLDALLGPEATPLAVVGAPALAELLGERRSVVELGAEPVAALVVVEPVDEPTLRAQLAQTREGGRVVLMGKASAALSRLALCAGLIELEAHDVAGKTSVFGRIWKAPGSAA